MLLIEAKAHEAELLDEAKGKLMESEPSDNSAENHGRIGTCIEEANTGLTRDTGLQWQLSRDRCYQMSNRFASAWKLADMGYPVVLVYLGFIGADEMIDRSKPISDAGEWGQLVRAHCAPVVPVEIWDRKWTVSGQPFIPLIRTYEQTIQETTG